MPTTSSRSTGRDLDEIPLVSIRPNSIPASCLTDGTINDSRLSKRATQPRPLRMKRDMILLNVAIDVTLLWLNLLFLSYGATVLAHDQEPIANHPRLVPVLLEVSRIGPTVFPILFTAVVGRFTKTALIWRLERGATVGSLDLLAGSTTLFNTITTMILTHTSLAIGCCLVVIWGLSPIGGQASLRLISMGQGTTTHSATFGYVLQNRSAQAFYSGDDENQLEVVFTLLTASLLSPWSIKTSATDQWGNLKVPMVESLENTTTPDPEGWWVVSNNEQVYASLIGVPLSGTGSDNTTSEMTFETAYWRLQCSPPFAGNGSLLVPFNPRTWPNPSDSAGNDPYSIAPSNNSSSAGTVSNSATIWSNTTGHSTDPSDPTAKYIPRTIIYGTWDPTGPFFGGIEQSWAICQIYTSYVEVGVTCSAEDCAAQAIRRSKQSHLPDEITLFDTDVLLWSYFNEWFVTAVPAHDASASAMVTYMVAPESPYDVNVNQSLASLDPGTYEIRFAQLLNTLWSAASGMYAISEGLSPLTNNNGSPTNMNAENATTNGTLTTSFEVIQCNRVWLTLLVIPCLLMLLASGIQITFEFIRCTPTLALNVSTMLRDNPYVQGPDCGSTLDATERTKLFKGVRVRFGDVAPEDDIGHLAIGSLECGGAVGKARKGRLYD